MISQCLVLLELKQLIGIDFSSFRVLNVEFGVNLKGLIKSSLILNYCLIAGSTKIKDVSLSNWQSNYKQATKQNYWIKLYDKKKQYKDEFNLTDDILRFEIKYKRMVALNNLGFYCMNDLLDKAIVSQIINEVVKCWDSIILFDKSIKKESLTRYEKEVKINQWNNANYWLELKPKERFKQKQKYNEVVKKHSNNVHLEVRARILSKLNNLSS